MAERTVEEFIFEYWDCPKCSNKAIRGDEYKCPNCGYPRDNSITFYRKQEEEVIESKDSVENFEKGPDWVCSFCESLNHQGLTVCTGCGSTKDDSEKNYFDELKKREQKTKAKEDIKVEEKPKSKSKALYWIAGILSLFIGFVCWGTGTHAEIYNIKDVSWTRAISVERYKWENRTDWIGDLKGDDPQEISRSREIKRYDKVPAGTRTESYTDTERYKSGTREECSTSYNSTGSGASKKVTKCRDVPVYSTRNVNKTRQVTIYKDVPVYDIRVSYKSKNFTPLGYYWKKGNDNDPKWPEVSLGSGVDDRSDKKGEKLESLSVTLSRQEGKDGPETLMIETNENLFKNKYKVGKQIEFEVNRLGGVKFEEGTEKFKEKDYEEKFNRVFRNSLN